MPFATFTEPDPDFDPLRDRLFVGGTVRTLDPGAPTAEALAVRGGRILAVGDEDAVRSCLAPDAETIDLDGAALLPGFHDAHVHLGTYGLERLDVPLGDTTSLEQAVARLRERAAATPQGSWVLGSGFALQRWDLREPDRAALDAAVPDHPVLLRSQDHHGGFANAVALDRAGLHAGSSDPAGGVVLRRADGTPTGYLLESAFELVAQAVPEPGPNELRAALVEGARSLAALGVTTVHHMAYEPPGRFRAMATIARDEAFPVRVWACIPQEGIEAARDLGLATGQGGDRFTIGGAKFFVDGALGSLTSWMLEPYLGSDDRGIALSDAATLEARVRAAIAAGFAPVVHAIGDAAVRRIVDVLEATAPALRSADLLPRIEHAQHVHPSDVARIGRLRVVASMQPLHLTFDAPTIHERLADRVARAYPIRSLLEAGAVVAFGSDTPVAPPDVVASLRAATRRRGIDGSTVAGHEAIGAATAVAAYTTGAATAIRREGRSGVLRRGADADLVAWSEDPSLDGFDAPKVRFAAVAGRIVVRN